MLRSSNGSATKQARSQSRHEPLTLEKGKSSSLFRGSGIFMLTRQFGQAWALSYSTVARRSTPHKPPDGRISISADGPMGRNGPPMVHHQPTVPRRVLIFCVSRAMFLFRDLYLQMRARSARSSAARSLSFGTFWLHRCLSPVETAYMSVCSVGANRRSASKGILRARLSSTVEIFS